MSDAPANGRVLRSTPMHRIREVDGSEDENADKLAELHCLTFFGGAPIRHLIEGIGGSLLTRNTRLRLPDWYRPPTRQMRDTSAG